MANPYVSSLTLTAANTDYTLNVNTNLGSNASKGFIRSKSTNSGTISIAFSYNGSTFSGWFDDLQPGETLSIDQVDVHTIKAKSTVASDVMIIQAFV